ncbi:MAG: C4-dicarboxylate ABC transporter permease [Betaproteobacteria bacterium RBG_16_66_20]|nr:MAG: C4-dicarboxylate ABC transporter permease [Betaproteobacteria bacterium RBG_16_66_20]
MDGITIGLVSVACMLVLIYAGMHVGVALTLLSFIGVWIIRGDAGIASNLLALAANDVIADYVFGVVPLFVLMGLLVSVADIGKDTFEVANQIFRRLRGGLGIATVAANAVFAAITGISIASAAVFTKVAVPEMLRHGYSQRFSVGVVAGSSVLGMLIPPSLLLILYGILTERSVGDLFIAGIIPGIVLSLAYVAGILLMGKYWPEFVGGSARTAEDSAQLGWGEMAGKLLPVVLLVALVLGGIYGGLFTPTEAGAVGAAGALALALAKGRLPLKSLWTVLVETGHITAAICFLIISAALYSRMLAISGVTEFLRHLIVDSGLGFWGMLAIFVFVVMLLGTILDSSSIMLITIPLVLPALQAFGTDLIWFGIVNLLAVEIGLLTPPFGIAVFVIKATLGNDSPITLNDIFAGALPFAVIMFLVLLLVIAFPGLATALI